MSFDLLDVVDLLRVRIASAEDDAMLDRVELAISELPVQATVQELVMILAPEIARKRRQLAKKNGPKSAHMSPVSSVGGSGLGQQLRAFDTGPAGRSVRRRQRRSREDG